MPLQAARGYSCIVIGAGLSGLSAASAVAAAGHSVIVVEARDRIGGRAYTISEGHGFPVDTGCAMIHGYYEGNPVAKLNADLGLKVILADSILPMALALTT